MLRVVSKTERKEKILIKKSRKFKARRPRTPCNQGGGGGRK